MLKGAAWISGVFALGVTTAHASSLCAEWDEAKEAGRLETKMIDEASGLAVSRKYNRLYHNNDSGDGPYFYVTERDGSKTQRIKIKGFKPWDVEEIGLGPCPDGTRDTCLVMADIGDNRERRKKIDILFVKEQAEFPKEVETVARWELKYPDRAHNAEAMVMTPQGYLVIVTKEAAKSNAAPAQVFRARLAPGEKKGVLQKTGTIDVPTIVNSKSLQGLVTAMTQTTDGSRFTLLTYGNAVEFALPLDTDEFPKPELLKAGRDFSLVPLVSLIQQEGMSYDTNERDLIYTSEDSFRLFSNQPPGLMMRVKCKKTF